ncbi:D-beta-hydroxybutyrate dehydrogenase [Mycobacterium marinum]|uniref:D-beta-hydroxybutyrate dehydrogenase n=1 Tax=Mycobacterium marinum TaxID=1781 RepID=A0A3E2MRS1_MYCMR|nr:SDR family NAD(P)-dependent oxidoreductase [Mycobacterium marinum]RFZ36310.1 D-beta-hydroxybutyrate dehydrogenase [Mycobacterium marinum]GJO42248.1 putative short-chain dehydrogenase/reductase [Mycobacterium marinum]
MKPSDIADTVLEATVVPSFSRIGPLLRSGLDHWTSTDEYRLDGRVIVITGATSGLGLVATRAWLEAGATVEIVARNPGKAAATVEQLQSEIAGAAVAATIAETADLDGLRNAAAALCARHDRIDVLVHNAGALDPSHAYAANGIEQTIASQVVGPFLLSALLYEPLIAAAPGRILWVSSGGMYTEPLSVDQLTIGPDEYRGTVAYARAKRAQVTLSEMMAERVDRSALVVHAMHPGWALTPGVERSLPTFRRVMAPLLRTAEQGADTLVWLAADDDQPLATTGGFWLDRRIRSLHKIKATRVADTPAERARLWEWVVAASGTDFPPQG